MPPVDVALIEWPENPDFGGPRLLGRTSNPRLVRIVSEHLAADRRRELARLEGRPVRLVPPARDEADGT